MLETIYALYFIFLLAYIVCAAGCILIFEIVIPNWSITHPSFEKACSESDKINMIAHNDYEKYRKKIITGLKQKLDFRILLLVISIILDCITPSNFNTCTVIAVIPVVFTILLIIDYKFAQPTED